MTKTLPKTFRSGYVAIIGQPNAGKSTLMNALLNVKLSIISPRPQTTRRRVLGILNRSNAQIVFIDTPGLLKPRYHLQKKMMDYVGLSLQDADVLLIIIDVSREHHPLDIDFKQINKQHKPMILLLNKIDLLSRGKLLPLMKLYDQFYPFQAIIPISALQNDGLDQLQKELLPLIPYGPPFYPPDVVSDQPERFFVAEIIREKIFLNFHEEIPYSTEVVIETYTERPRGKDFISAIIYVERTSQKAILIGKQGLALKRIGSQARKEIEDFLGRSVFLELRVKVAENWRKSEHKLRTMGY